MKIIKLIAAIAILLLMLLLSIACASIIFITTFRYRAVVKFYLNFLDWLIKIKQYPNVIEDAK